MEREVYDYTDDGKCKNCQHDMTPIGERYVLEQITLTEPKIIRRKIYQQTYKCVYCATTAEKPGQFCTNTPVPTPTIARSLALPSIIVAIIHQKY
ncbi:IS66 family transposase zinc-finger binding domain-containing protein [Lactiplantibacillus plantarum]|uniref:IS66 family transposase zinc-finger binding domain-containing protein n=1 Tax=Lactiplantibacillus plantarum TaxID=1590 RepID=UPI003434D8CB